MTVPSFVRVSAVSVSGSLGWDGVHCKTAVWAGKKRGQGRCLSLLTGWVYIEIHAECTLRYMLSVGIHRYRCWVYIEIYADVHAECRYT